MAKRIVCESHGHAKVHAPEYRSWCAMKNRCSDSKHHEWHRYGGRGIKVCDRWANSFLAFLADMGPRPSLKYSLDRYPNRDGNYEPGNVRWATMKEQRRNTSQNHFLTWKGETKTIVDWSIALNLAWNTIYNRLRRGWSIDAALATPPQMCGSRVVAHRLHKSGLRPDGSSSDEELM